MTTKAKAKTTKHYVTPTTTAYATACATVSLDEFSIEEIQGYLAHKGEAAVIGAGELLSDQKGGLYIEKQTLDQIFTLDLCGQRDPAREMALRLISNAIGREL